MFHYILYFVSDLHKFLFFLPQILIKSRNVVVMSFKDFQYIQYCSLDHNTYSRLRFGLANAINPAYDVKSVEWLNF